jgi:hypothetical protein
MVNPQADTHRTDIEKGHNLQSNVILATLPCDITFSAKLFVATNEVLYLC